MRRLTHHVSNTRSRSVLVGLLWLAVGAVQAAAPSPGSAQPGLQAGPPQLVSFTVAGGAARTWVPTVSLAWTASGSKATHWRVSAMSTFPGAAWQPVPATPASKFSLEGVAEGQTTLHLQLMNDSGQSAVRNATIDWRQRPLLQAASVQAAFMAERMANVQMSFTGRVTRWALAPSAQPPADAAAWQVLNAPSSGFIANWVPMNAPLFATHFVTGQTYNAYVHVQRDDSPFDSRAVSFVYSAPVVSVSLDYPGPIAPVLDKLLRRGRVVARSLSGGALCQVRSGWAGNAPSGQNEMIVSLPSSNPAATVARCRFEFFGGQPLASGWTLERIDFSSGSRCQVHGVTVGSRPSASVEGTIEAGYSSPTRCYVTRIDLKGPLGSGDSVTSAIP